MILNRKHSTINRIKSFNIRGYIARELHVCYAQTQQFVLQYNYCIQRSDRPYSNYLVKETLV